MPADNFCTGCGKKPYRYVTAGYSTSRMPAGTKSAQVYDFMWNWHGKLKNLLLHNLTGAVNKKLTDTLNRELASGQQRPFEPDNRVVAGRVWRVYWGVGTYSGYGQRVCRAPGGVKRARPSGRGGKEGESNRDHSVCAWSERIGPVHRRVQKEQHCPDEGGTVPRRGDNLSPSRKNGQKSAGESGMNLLRR